MSIHFTTTVSENDWDARFSGWRCPALEIPSASIKDVFIGGTKQDTAIMEVDHKLKILIWKGNKTPPEALISYEISENLTTEDIALGWEDTALKWKKLSILLPVLATLIAGIVGPILTYKLTESKTVSLSTENMPERVEFINTMWDYFNDKEYETAKGIADEIVTKYNEIPHSLMHAYTIKGEVEYENKNYSQAIVYLKKSLSYAQEIKNSKSDFSKQICARNLSRAYIAINAPKMALETLSEIREPVVDDFDWKYAVGRAYLYNSNYEESIKYFEQIPNDWTWSKDKSKGIAKIHEASAYIGLYEEKKLEKYLIKAERIFTDGFNQNISLWQNVLIDNPKAYRNYLLIQSILPKYVFDWKKL